MRLGNVLRIAVVVGLWSLGVVALVASPVDAEVPTAAELVSPVATPVCGDVVIGLFILPPAFGAPLPAAETLQKAVAPCESFPRPATIQCQPDTTIKETLAGAVNGTPAEPFAGLPINVLIFAWLAGEASAADAALGGLAGLGSLTLQTMNCSEVKPVPRPSAPTTGSPSTQPSIGDSPLASSSGAADSSFSDRNDIGGANVDAVGHAAQPDAIATAPTSARTSGGHYQGIVAAAFIGLMLLAAAFWALASAASR